MKKILLFSILSCASIIHSLACTTFFLNRNGQMVFGRNYDWVTGNGMVCSNQRGLSKTSSKTRDGETISWVSKYGSITFNQYGKEFPTGGMNEKGLVVELMWLDGTIYPAPDKRPSVGVLQWIQYQLDNCSSIEDVIASDKEIRIATMGTSPLHYLVADANGNAATIEFQDGKMLVHKGKDLPLAVLTNDRYASSLQLTQSTGGNGHSFTSNSIDRFAKACNRVKAFQQGDVKGSVIDYSFSILSEVAQGSHTKWSIVYDIANRKVYFRSLGFTDIKSIAFSDLDLSCKSPAKAWDINQAAKGDIAKLLADFSIEMNNRIVRRSFEESKTQFTVSEEGQKETANYPAGIQCSEKEPLRSK